MAAGEGLRFVALADPTDGPTAYFLGLDGPLRPGQLRELKLTAEEFADSSEVLVGDAVLLIGRLGDREVALHAYLAQPTEELAIDAMAEAAMSVPLAELQPASPAEAMRRAARAGAQSAAGRYVRAPAGQQAAGERGAAASSGREPRRREEPAVSPNPAEKKKQFISSTVEAHMSQVRGGDLAPQHTARGAREALARRKRGNNNSRGQAKVVVGMVGSCNAGQPGEMRKRAHHMQAGIDGGL